MEGSWLLGYVVDLQVGTPPQAVRAVADTGSYLTWLATTSIIPTPIDPLTNKPIHPADFSKSSTFVNLHTNLSTSFGNGRLFQGVWATDDFHVGGYAARNVMCVAATLLAFVHDAAWGLSPYNYPTSAEKSQWLSYELFQVTTHPPPIHHPSTHSPPSTTRPPSRRTRAWKR